MEKALRETQTLRAAYAGGVRPPSLYKIFVADSSNRSKVIRRVNSKVSKLGHVTQATPI